VGKKRKVNGRRQRTKVNPVGRSGVKVAKHRERQWTGRMAETDQKLKYLKIKIVF